MLRTFGSLLVAVTLAACLVLSISIRDEIGELREEVGGGGVPAPDGEGLVGQGGRVILGPTVQGNRENELAVSLAVGLQRSDGLLFGEFARARREAMCPGAQASDFARLWVEGDERYSIAMPAAGTEGQGCGEPLVIAEVDWRNAEVVVPAAANSYGTGVTWLEAFRAGEAP